MAEPWQPSRHWQTSENRVSLHFFHSSAVHSCSDYHRPLSAHSHTSFLERIKIPWKHLLLLNQISGEQTRKITSRRVKRREIQQADVLTRSTRFNGRMFFVKRLTTPVGSLLPKDPCGAAFLSIQPISSLFPRHFLSITSLSLEKILVQDEGKKNDYSNVGRVEICAG